VHPQFGIPGKKAIMALQVPGTRQSLIPQAWYYKGLEQRRANDTIHLHSAAPQEKHK